MAGTAVSAYTRRGAQALGAITLLSLACAGYLLLAPGNGQVKRSVGADGYSRSAIGHQGLMRLLRDLGEPVVQMRMARALDACGLLVLAEPGTVRQLDAERIADWMDTAGATLVVLPKRRGFPDPERPDWVDDVDLVSPERVGSALAASHVWRHPRPPRIVRVDAAHGWVNDWPSTATSRRLPTIAGPVQLLEADDDHLVPLLKCDEGVLLGQVVDESGLFVLSDPDVLNNHGLGKGDNAMLVVGLLRDLRGNSTIVFDETLHGHRLEPNIWVAAGTFPFVLVPVHLLLLAALVAWIANGRFGPARELPPAIRAGKEFLIDNTASLLRRGGHHGPSLRRYARQRVRHAVDALHAPATLAAEQSRDWLLARTHDGQRRQRLAALLQKAETAVPANEAAAVARDIHNLTEEVPHAGR